MNTSRTARLTVLAALACVLFWAAKAVAIGIAGGLDRSPLESPFFLLGLLAHVTTIVLLGLLLTGGRPVVVRGLVVVGLVAAGIALDVVGAMVLESVRPADPSWVWSEINLWFGAVLVLTLVLVLVRRLGTRATSTPRTA